MTDLIDVSMLCTVRANAPPRKSLREGDTDIRVSQSMHIDAQDVTCVTDRSLPIRLQP
jgi:hypothetical protein